MENVRRLIAGPGSTFGGAGSGWAVIAVPAEAAVRSMPLNITGSLRKSGTSSS